MADRTLRRAYNRTNGVEEPVPNATGSDEGSAPVTVSGNTDADTSINGNGENAIGESHSAERIGYVTVDPSNLGDYIESESRAASERNNGNRTRKPRSDAGKPRGTRTRKGAEIPTLVTIHNLLNSWGQFLFKELELDEEEKKKLDSALETFAQYHELPLLSQKRASELELANVLAMVYGPRFYVIYNKMKMEARIKHAKKVNPFVVQQQEHNEVRQ